MRTLILLSIVVLICIQCANKMDYIEPDNLLKSFSFESGPSDLTSGRTPNTDFEIIWTNEESFDGNGSLKISSSTQNNTGLGYWKYELVNPVPDSKISLIIRAKAVDIIGKGFAVTMGSSSSQNNVQTEIVGLDEMQSTDNWMELKLSLTQPIPQGVETVSMFFILLDTTEGTVYFDRLEIISE